MKTLLVGILLISLALNAHAYDSGKAGFSVMVNGEENPYAIFSVFVLPGSELSIQSQVALTTEGQSLVVLRQATGQLVLRTPQKPGAYVLKLLDPEARSMQLNVLVMVPVAEKKGEYLKSYRIGNYPTRPLNGNAIYNRPKGFFEVTAENRHLQLTPHFTLGQFTCKQQSGYPQFVILRERLLLKLEYLLERVNDHGYAIETFGFISGYRTPYYNAQIKNVQYSRHVYGGASDIFIDQDNDGRMDDLNRDGEIDDADVRIFYNIVEGESDKPEYRRFAGGLGFYHKNSRHAGFIHVDVRGAKARW